MIEHLLADTLFPTPGQSVLASLTVTWMNFQETPRDFIPSSSHSFPTPSTLRVPGPELEIFQIRHVWPLSSLQSGEVGG